MTWQALSAVRPVFLGMPAVAVGSGADVLHMGVAFLVELPQDAGEAVGGLPRHAAKRQLSSIRGAGTDKSCHCSSRVRVATIPTVSRS